MKTFTDSLNNFWIFASKNKLWTFSASVFIFCFWFALNTFVSEPNQRLELHQREADLEMKRAENDIIISINKLGEKGLRVTSEGQQIFQDFLDQADREKKIPERQEMEEYAKRIDKVNDDITQTIASLESISSNNSDLDKYAKDFASDLSEFQATFVEMENSFRAILDNDYQKFDKSCDYLDEQLVQYERYLIRTGNRLNGWLTFSTKLITDRINQQFILDNDKKIFKIRHDLAIGAAILDVTFLLISGRRWLIYARARRLAQKPKRNRH